MVNRVMNAIHEADQLMHRHTKGFEAKKMLRAKVHHHLKQLLNEKPMCSAHTKHQRDYQLKIDFVNNRRLRERRSSGETANEGKQP